MQKELGHGPGMEEEPEERGNGSKRTPNPLTNIGVIGIAVLVVTISTWSHVD